MNPSLIAATILFAPAAVAGPAVALAWWRHRGEHEAALAAFASVQQPAPFEPPPDGGMPTPATEPEHLAQVIPFPTRHAA